MKIKSISTAQGWFRIRGLREESYHLEEITVFAVIETDTGTGQSVDIIVGIPSIDFGVSGNEEEQYLKDVAGYVKESQTELDRSGKRVLKAVTNAQIDWEI